MYNIPAAFASPSFQRFKRKFWRFIKYDVFELLTVLIAAWVLTEVIQYYFF